MTDCRTSAALRPDNYHLALLRSLKRLLGLCRPVVIGVCLFLMPAQPSFGGPLSNVYSGFQSFGDVLLPDGSQLNFGLGPQFGPDYLGSDDYGIQADVVFQLKLGRILNFDNDGAEVNILGKRKIQFGPVVKFTGGRDEAQNPALDGLGNIGASLDLGLFAKTIIDERYALRLRLRRAAFSGTKGAFLDLRFTTLLYQRDSFSLATGATATWVSSKVAERFFGVSPEQSLSSGLAPFEIGSTGRDVRVNAAARWEFADRWTMNGYAEYSRLLGSVANSPIVADFGSANQFTIGAYVAYNFQF